MNMPLVVVYKGLLKVSVVLLLKFPYGANKQGKYFISIGLAIFVFHT